MAATENWNFANISSPEARSSMIMMSMTHVCGVKEPSVITQNNTKLVNSKMAAQISK